MSELRMPLNKTQLEILKLFSQPLSEEELNEIKKILVKHLADKLSLKADKVSQNKGYTKKDFDNWLNDSEQ